MTFRGLALATLAAATALTGCADDGSSVALVPSSMTGIVGEIDLALESETDWVIAGSSRLVAQLADGAEAEILITADAITMDDAAARGLVAGEPVVFAGNRLVVALAPGNPGEVAHLSDLNRGDLLIGVCAPEVPCGRLAAEAADALDLDLSIDTEEPNVRSLANKVASGELDAGLIYATDAADLELETLDTNALAPFVTSYLVVSVDGETSTIADFLVSPAGQALLATQGFSRP